MKIGAKSGKDVENWASPTAPHNEEHNMVLGSGRAGAGAGALDRGWLFRPLGIGAECLYVKPDRQRFNGIWVHRCARRTGVLKPAKPSYQTALLHPGRMPSYWPLAYATLRHQGSAMAQTQIEIPGLVIIFFIRPKAF